MLHDHDHGVQVENINTSFIVGIVLNLVFVATEAIAGLMTHSLSLLTDAGHNLADVASLALSLLAFKLMKTKPTAKYTYGFKKTSILVALLNSVILLLSIGAIMYEAILRFSMPKVLPGTTIAIVAFVGFVINTVSALLFFRNKDKDLNIKSAYLHLLADAAVSLSLVAGGIVMYFTKWYWIDNVFSISIAIIILFSTWNLLKESLRLSMDGVPDSLSIEEVKTIAQDIKGVEELHHVHIWAIGSATNAMTAHLVLADDVTTEAEQDIKEILKHRLLHKNIQHITLETERLLQPCNQKNC